VTDTEQHRHRLRRLRILQHLSFYAPNPLGERTLLNLLLNDAELEPTVERVRDSIEYLADVGLVSVVRVADVALPWMAAYITPAGAEWLHSDKAHGLEIYNPDYQPPASAAGRGKTSSVDKLNAETRAWLDANLIDKKLSYQELVNLLAQKGLTISHSALGRYAKKLKERVAHYAERAEIAKRVAEVFEGDSASIMQGAMGTATTAILDAIEGRQYNDGNDSLGGLVKALPQLQRGFRDAEKQKLERAAREQTIKQAAEVGQEAAIAAGMDDQQAAFWRDKFLKGM